jgi:ABC-type transporter MlaC component
MEEVGREILVLSLGVGAALFGRWAWDRATAADRAERAARESDAKIQAELQHYGRRVEDRFVLRDVCERCQNDQEHQAAAVGNQLRDLKEEMRRNFETVFSELRRLSSGLNAGKPSGYEP